MMLLPRGTKSLVVSLHGIGFENHQVIGANVLTGCFIAALATVTFLIDDKTWHL